MGRIMNGENRSVYSSNTVVDRERQVRSVDIHRTYGPVDSTPDPVDSTSFLGSEERWEINRGTGRPIKIGGTGRHKNMPSYCKNPGHVGKKRHAHYANAEGVPKRLCASCRDNLGLQERQNPCEECKEVASSVHFDL